jgi:hypothetical protein
MAMATTKTSQFQKHIKNSEKGLVFYVLPCHIAILYFDITGTFTFYLLIIYLQTYFFIYFI